MSLIHRPRIFAALLVSVLLSGCGTVVLNPSGWVAKQQGSLVVVSTVLMLLIVVPVMVLIVIFAWRYRKSNEQARYEPDWDHSTQLELVIWAAPLLIIIALGAITWIATHTLDPYRPLNKLDGGRPIPGSNRPLTVEVVALDWKWLFIYPDQGIASVNELVVPVDVPIEFKITSASVMNSFYIPALAGQIYAMAGMETKLHGVINKAGVFDGFSAHYSGAGFSDMRFKFHGVSSEDFGRWVEKTKADTDKLDRPSYMRLAQPSIAPPIKHYGSIAPDLYGAILNQCVEAGKTCMNMMMAGDAMNAGHGHGSGATTSTPLAVKNAPGEGDRAVPGAREHDGMKAMPSAQSPDATPAISPAMPPAAK